MGQKKGHTTQTPKNMPKLSGGNKSAACTLPPTNPSPHISSSISLSFSSLDLFSFFVKIVFNWAIVLPYVLVAYYTHFYL